MLKYFAASALGPNDDEGNYRSSINVMLFLSLFVVSVYHQSRNLGYISNHVEESGHNMLSNKLNEIQSIPKHHSVFGSCVSRRSHTFSLFAHLIHPCIMFFFFFQKKMINLILILIILILVNASYPITTGIMFNFPLSLPKERRRRQ